MNCIRLIGPFPLTPDTRHPTLCPLRLCRRCCAGILAGERKEDDHYESSYRC